MREGPSVSVSLRVDEPDLVQLLLGAGAALFGVFCMFVGIIFLYGAVFFTPSLLVTIATIVVALYLITMGSLLIIIPWS